MTMNDIFLIYRAFPVKIPAQVHPQNGPVRLQSEKKPALDHFSDLLKGPSTSPKGGAFYEPL
ncbi:hypothetical protein [uncultured Oscillibacter sp.]|uniref:hypothetical protein n=1 Tax=uncultured Oscillibacter sp. TaxID=876091 RepID=UPI002625DEA9|nr:hypothetical protein [uncultured Oscillibacter sp.]